MRIIVYLSIILLMISCSSNKLKENKETVYTTAANYETPSECKEFTAFFRDNVVYDDSSKKHYVINLADSIKLYEKIKKLKSCWQGKTIIEIQDIVNPFFTSKVKNTQPINKKLYRKVNNKEESYNFGYEGIELDDGTVKFLKVILNPPFGYYIEYVSIPSMKIEDNQMTIKYKKDSLQNYLAERIEIQQDKGYLYYNLSENTSPENFYYTLKENRQCWKGIAHQELSDALKIIGPPSSLNKELGTIVYKIYYGERHESFYIGVFRQKGTDNISEVIFTKDNQTKTIRFQ